MLVMRIQKIYMDIDASEANTRHTPDAAGVVEALEALIREYDRQTDKGAAPVLTNAQRSARAELKAYKEQLEN